MALKQCPERMEQRIAKESLRLEYSFRVIKQQFGYLKVQNRGTDKNAEQPRVLFVLLNRWMLRSDCWLCQ